MDHMLHQKIIFIYLEKINDYYFIKFKTKWDEWERKIKYLDNKKMILENNNFEYHYKRHFN